MWNCFIMSFFFYKMFSFVYRNNRLNIRGFCLCSFHWENQSVRMIGKKYSTYNFFIRFSIKKYYPFTRHSMQIYFPLLYTAVKISLANIFFPATRSPRLPPNHDIWIQVFRIFRNVFLTNLLNLF